MLTKAGIKHNVLNARQHEQEAQIVGDAGKIGAVTIATNMAGRGTDIQLGGNVEMRVLAALAENQKVILKHCVVPSQKNTLRKKKKCLPLGAFSYWQQNATKAGA